MLNLKKMTALGLYDVSIEFGDDYIDSPSPVKVSLNTNKSRSVLVEMILVYNKKLQLEVA